MKIKLTLFALLISVLTFAQTGINYKALIKDVNGNVINNSVIEVQFILLQGDELTEIYNETHEPTTDDNGILVVTIGEGTTTGDFRNIDWILGEVFLNVQIDTGDGFIDFGTTQFKYVPFAYASETAVKAKNVNGLEAIEEGGNQGWRLIGRDSSLHGNIGQNAVDLSYNTSDAILVGATGENSFAFGLGARASATNSLALGLAANASASSSIALGFISRASGSNAVALGPATEASGNSSLATGAATIASGYASTAMGENTIASGNHSTGLGRNIRAEASNVTAVGRYNIGGGNPDTWLVSDPLFEIGNGSSSSNRNNALTVLKNGTHIINSSSIGLSVNSAVTGMTINNPGLDAISIANPGDDGISITDSGDNGIVISNSTDNGIYIFDSQTDGVSINNAVDDGISISLPGDDGIIITSPGDDGIVITDPDDVGISVSGAGGLGAIIQGTQAGLRASSSVSENPDIVLGATGTGSSQDDGIISSSPSIASSDMYLRSNDAVVVQLDYDNNEAGNFRIRNGEEDVIFDVTESGNVNMGERLRLGPVTIEKNDFSTNFVEINSSVIPSNDNEFVLGLTTNRWFRVYSVNGVTSTSDRREKKNIKNLYYGLDEVLQMQPVSFNWKNKNDPDLKLGLIAQELQKLVPEVVHSHIWEKDEASGALTKKELDRLGVYYSDLVPVLINAIKDQQELIEKLQFSADSQQSKINKQNTKYLNLLQRIETLEANASINKRQ